MINAQNLNDISLQSIGDDEGRLGNDELTCARDAAGTPHFGAASESRTAQPFHSRSGDVSPRSLEQVCAKLTGARLLLE